MIVKTKKFYDEFWGAKLPVYEHDVEEEYSGEVEKFLKKQIDKGLDYIPSQIGVTLDGDLTLYDGDIIIYSSDYLSDEQWEELKKYIEEEEEE